MEKVKVLSWRSFVLNYYIAIIYVIDLLVGGAVIIAGLEAQVPQTIPTSWVVGIGVLLILNFCNFNLIRFALTKKKN